MRGLVGRSRTHSRCKATHGLRTRVLQNCWRGGRDREARRVVDRLDVDLQRHWITLVVSTIRRAAVVAQCNTQSGHTTDIRRGREAQLTVAGNGGRTAEQGRIAIAQHHKIDGLHFIRVAIADAAGPSSGVGTVVLIDRYGCGARSKDWGGVHTANREGEIVVDRCIDTPVGGAAVVLQNEAHHRRTGGVGRRCIAQCAGGDINRRRDQESEGPRC